MFEKIRKIMVKEFPLYVTIGALAAWSFILVYFSIIPTSYTVDAASKNLVRSNTGLQIELLERYPKMDGDALFEFLQENLKFSIMIEQIICGKLSEAATSALKKLEAPPEVPE